MFGYVAVLTFLMQILPPSADAAIIQESLERPTIQAAVNEAAEGDTDVTSRFYGAESRPGQVRPGLSGLRWHRAFPPGKWSGIGPLFRGRY